MKAQADIPLAGFLLVRKPGRDHFTLERQQSPEAVLRSGLAYQGVDRMPWSDWEDLFWRGNLPEPVQAEWRGRRQRCGDRMGFVTLPDIEDVVGIKRVLASLSSAHVAEENEVIGVRSPMLNVLRGSHPMPSASLEYLGADVISPGEWSLIREGVFLCEQGGAEMSALLNAYGLLASREGVKVVLTKYDEYVKAGLVEETAGQVEVVDVYRPRVGG